jgi:hypothetical protein
MTRAYSEAASAESAALPDAAQRAENLSEALPPRSGGRRDLYAGGLMVLVGAFAVYRGLSYHVGSLTRMGPGFFPVALGIILILTGLAIAATARLATTEEGGAGERWEGVDWRGCICIALGLIAFMLLGRHGGLLPATFAIVFISALGDRNNSLLSAAVLAAGICVLCVIVFWWALQLQLPLFAWDW